MQEDQRKGIASAFKIFAGLAGTLVTLWVLSTYPPENPIWPHLAYWALIPSAWLISIVHLLWKYWTGNSQRKKNAVIGFSLFACIGITYCVVHLWPNAQASINSKARHGGLQSPPPPAPEPHVQQPSSDPKPRTDSPDKPNDSIARHSEPPTGNPIIDLAIGEIFKNPTVIIVKNAAPAPAMNAYVNLRCILVDTTRGPMAFTLGNDSIENEKVWWQIGKISSDMKPLVKDFRPFAVSCLENKENMEKFSQSGNQPFVIGETILVADLTFQSGREMTRATETRIATLGYSAGTGILTTFPLTLSDKYKLILEKAKATSFR